MKKTVFLPCHPNMWEGFETIWDKETSTPDNDVKVIPIPTYKRMIDNSLLDAEYITDSYPVNVSVSGINDYDLASEHPDTIYIQNVQDTDCPAFTVHPHFHTAKLRSFTDNLVYIPYNCMGELELDLNYLRRYYSKILTPPGIHNVDRIIVHSQHEKDIYLALIAGLDKSEREKWARKISYEDYPRTNILKKYTKDSVQYPNSWNRHLFNSEGKRKNCVLFVTSVFGILEFNRSHLREAKEIMQEYLDRKGDTALIWRPHKYLPEIIIKMRPELFDDFRALLEYYITNDIGIFDETPTPTPAIVLSDSYIGDACTVKELFKSTGKNILE